MSVPILPAETDPLTPYPTVPVEAHMSDWTNQLYFGDNLSVLREHIPDASD